MKRFRIIVLSIFTSIISASVADASMDLWFKRLFSNPPPAPPAIVTGAPALNPEIANRVFLTLNHELSALKTRISELTRMIKSARRLGTLLKKGESLEDLSYILRSEFIALEYFGMASTDAYGKNSFPNVLASVLRLSSHEGKYRAEVMAHADLIIASYHQMLGNLVAALAELKENVAAVSVSRKRFQGLKWDGFRNGVNSLHVRAENLRLTLEHTAAQYGISSRIRYPHLTVGIFAHTEQLGDYLATLRDEIYRPSLGSAAQPIALQISEIPPNLFESNPHLLAPPSTARPALAENSPTRLLLGPASTPPPQPSAPAPKPPVVASSARAAAPKNAEPARPIPYIKYGLSGFGIVAATGGIAYLGYAHQKKAKDHKDSAK